MSLKTKVLVAVMGTLTCLLVVTYLLASRISLNAFLKLEEREVQVNVRRALDALSSALAEQGSKCSDWAHWDDSYDFIVSRDPTFSKKSFTSQTMEDLNLNLLLFVNRTGNIVAQQTYDMERHVRSVVPRSWLEEYFTAHPQLALQHDEEVEIDGVMLMSGRLLLVSSRALLTSEGQGPGRGTLIFARSLDESKLDALAATTHLSLELYVVGDPDMPAEFREMQSILSETNETAVRRLGPDRVAGYALILDLEGQPAAVLRVDTPRDIYRQGQTSTSYLGLALLVAGLVFCGLALLLMQRMVLDPLGRLKAGVNHLSVGDLNFRIRLDQQDELGQVAAAFNRMAVSLHHREEQLAENNAMLAEEVEQRRQAQEELRRMNGSLEQQVAERTAELVAEVNERKRAQQKLEAYAAKLEASNRELQDFAYVSSHDLQEPLRKIQAFGDRLRERYGSALGDQGQDYLSRMQNAAARMQALIEGLLSYSRVTTKAQPFASVNLAEVVSEVLSDLETRVEEQHATIKVGDLPTIEADPLQMRQLLQNLIGNALKFHREDIPPVITISSQPHHSANRNGNGTDGCPDAVEIHVQDNGIGFEEKYTDRIFQVFQRLHGRGMYDGAGIGLSVCRRITERHGGQITALSTPGAGTTFIVTLPVVQAGEA